MKEKIMKIIALLTCYNRKEKTERAIRSLVTGNPGIEFKFIIVDDKSTDGTSEMLNLLKIEGIDIEYIKGNGRLFYSGGMHIAMNTALGYNHLQYNYILLMNDDVLFYENAVEKLVVQCRDKSDSVIVGVTCDSNGNYSYGAIKYKRGIHYWGVGIEYNDLPCDTFNANCVLIPKKFFVKSGGMDPHYKHGLGDFDFGLAIKRQGANIFPSREYVGMCEPNSSKGSWTDASISRMERIRKKENPKGQPFRIWFYFLNKNFGLFYAVWYSFTPYLRILMKC